MNKNLLHKTQRTYVYFLILLFVIVAPLFYVIANKLYLDEVDETLMLYKSEFLRNSISKLKEKEIVVLNNFSNNIQIQKYTGLKNDTLFNKSYFNYVEKEDEPYRELNSHISIEGKPYTLSVKTNLLESEDFIMAIVVLFASILILLFIGLLLINKYLSVRLWKPFYQTLRQIENFEIDKHLKPHFVNTDIEEFKRLNNSLDRLIERNIIIYNNQREFVENAAHELQTPIAIFKAKIDSLIQRTDITQGQSEILSSLSETTSRLSRLNKNLLLLSKIEKQSFAETETISLKEIIEIQLEFFVEQAKRSSIEIKTNFQNDITLNSNKGLVEIMLSNLLLNSIRHNKQNGIIAITLSEKEISISNTGKEEALTPDKIFSRFSKSGSSENGNGLGLAIVKKIADLNNWSISYSYSEKQHFIKVKFQ